MKALIILLGFFSFTSHAILLKSLPSYTVVSEKPDFSIPKGSSIVVGNVSTWEGTAISNALVSTVDFEKQTTTDSLGNFRLVLSDQDSAIFFFYFNYSEIVLYYDFKSQNVLTVQFYAQHNWEQITVDKPVIYCYSDEPISVDLSLGFKSELTFSYPQYNEGWNFQVDINGINANGNQYPYLFWEGKTNELNYSVENSEVEGYLVKTDTVVSFLENTLTSFGLNQTEKVDFITFWGPKMINTDYALVQFKSGAIYADEIASINVNPQPESMLRIFMVYSPIINENLGNIELSQPKIPEFKREGFTLVEWGGSEIPIEHLLLNIIN